MDQIGDLVAAINEQTNAINALVQSNRELMDYLVGDEAQQDEEQQPAVYMDGSPVR